MELTDPDADQALADEITIDQLLGDSLALESELARQFDKANGYDTRILTWAQCQKRAKRVVALARSDRRESIIELREERQLAREADLSDRELYVVVCTLTLDELLGEQAISLIQQHLIDAGDPEPACGWQQRAAAVRTLGMQEVEEAIAEHKQNQALARMDAETQRRADERLAAGMVSFADRRDAPPMRWLVDDVIPYPPANADEQEGYVGQLWGASGQHKTFVALDLALRIANRMPEWFGFALDPECCGPVAYFNLEDQSGLQPRVNAWLKGHAGTKADDLYVVQPKEFDLLDPDSVDRHVDLLLDVRPAIVIIDTQRAATPSISDERGNSEIGRVLHAARDMGTALGCPVLLVHHSVDNGSRAGGSAQTGVLEFELRVAGKAITHVKSRHGEEFAGSRRFRLQTDVDLGDGGKPGAYIVPAVEPGAPKPNTSAVPEKRSSTDDVLAAAERCGEGFSAQDLEPMVDLSSRQIRRLLTSLTDAGELVLVHEAVLNGSESRPATYRIVED